MQSEIPPAHLDHPIYSCTEETLWTNVAERSDVMPIEDSLLQEFVDRFLPSTIAAAHRVMRTLIHESVISTKPPAPQTILVRAVGDGSPGCLTYMDFTMPNSGRSDSDSWWVIVACPRPFDTSLPDHAKFPVWSLGWFAQ